MLAIMQNINRGVHIHFEETIFDMIEHIKGLDTLIFSNIDPNLAKKSPEEILVIMQEMKNQGYGKLAGSV